MSPRTPVIVYTVDDKSHSGYIEGSPKELRKDARRLMAEETFTCVNLKQDGQTTIIPGDKITAITIQETP